MARISIPFLLALTALTSIGFAQLLPGIPVKYAARGMRGAVAAGTEPATEAGMRIYHKGGTAVDAGLATMFADATTEFSLFGWGGESPILVRTKDGKVHSIAGVGPMPKLGTADFFRNHKLGEFEVRDPPDPGGLKYWGPTAGILCAVVPGMVEGALVTLREYGTLSFADVVQPSIDLADGFPIDEPRSQMIRAYVRHLNAWPSSKRVFLPNGSWPRAGEIFRQPDLARTLRSMADVEKKARAAGKTREQAIDAVRDFFYRGEIAHKIDEFMKANGGLIRYDDMANFRVEPEEPVSTTYRGMTVYKPGFWSQGPSMIETLNILENFDLPGMKVNSAEYIHTLVEALKLAYADRDTYYGDPKFNKIPMDRLLSKEYGAERAKQIGHDASLEFRPGNAEPNPPKHPSLSDLVVPAPPAQHPPKDTTCIDAIDADGVAISITPSGGWLPSVIAGDTGLELSERAESFLLIPGHPNEMAPGKRPRVTLSPTLVTAPNKTVMTFSTPGGDNQDQALLQVFLYASMFNYDAEHAVEAPRFQTEHLVSSFDNHPMNIGSLLLPDRTAPEVVADLKARNHKVELKNRYESGSAPVFIRLLPSGVIEAGADPFYYRSARAW